jgi:hypothetical protein
MEIWGNVMSFANIEVPQALKLEIDRYHAHAPPTTQPFRSPASLAEQSDQAPVGGSKH